MKSIEKRKFVTVCFSCIERQALGGITTKSGTEIHINCPQIIELGAVKIENDVITKHYSTFVGIDGFDPHDIVFDDTFVEFNGITPEHLIGAPNLEEAIKTFYDFAEDCVIIIQNNRYGQGDVWNYFVDKAKVCGYVLNNPVISMTNIWDAKRLKDVLDETSEDGDFPNVLRLAEKLKREGSWVEIFKEYLAYDYNGRDTRHDALSLALAFSRLFILIVDWDKFNLKPIDVEDLPF